MVAALAVLIAALALVPPTQGVCVRLPAGSARADCAAASVALYSAPACEASALLATVDQTAHVVLPADASGTLWDRVVAPCVAGALQLRLEAADASTGATGPAVRGNLSGSTPDRAPGLRGPAARSWSLMWPGMQPTAVDAHASETDTWLASDTTDGLHMHDSTSSEPPLEPGWNPPPDQATSSHSLARRDPIPPGCRLRYEKTFSMSDDDDAASRRLAWPRAVHCSGAGLEAVPAVPEPVQYFHLGANNLTDLPSDAFVNLTALVKLLLYNNNIAALPDKAFSTLSALTYLYLNSNEITALEPGAFAGLVSLQYLYLNNNMISNVSAAAFNGLPALTYLCVELSSCPLVPASNPVQLSTLVHITRFYRAPLCGNNCMQLIELLTAGALPQIQLVYSLMASSLA
eukprot:m.95063 g.95063  ORF g.95063 m.95063 type:complete len:404 (+) comp8590_c0_seq2:45-1256(+)